MAKLLLILLIGLVFESTGVVLLKKGMTEIPELKRMDLREGIRVAKGGLKIPGSSSVFSLRRCSLPVFCC